MPNGECKHEIKIVPALKDVSVKEARLLCPCDFAGKNTGVDCHTMHAWSPASAALQVNSFLFGPPGKPEQNTTRLGRKWEVPCEGKGRRQGPQSTWEPPHLGTRISALKTTIWRTHLSLKTRPSIGKGNVSRNIFREIFCCLWYWHSIWFKSPTNLYYSFPFSIHCLSFFKIHSANIYWISAVRLQMSGTLIKARDKDIIPSTSQWGVREQQLNKMKTVYSVCVIRTMTVQPRWKTVWRFLK